MYYLQPSVGGTYFLLFLLFLHHAPTPTNAQGALHLQLASDCTVCITVDCAEGEFAVLQKGGCQTTAPRDKLWLMAQDASAGGGWWCLEDNPNLCAEEGGTLLLSAESETSPYQQFAFTEALRSKTGGLIIGGESDDCVTMVTGGVLMNDCAADRRELLEVMVLPCPHVAAQGKVERDAREPSFPDLFESGEAVEHAEIDEVRVGFRDVIATDLRVREIFRDRCPREGER